MSCLIKNNISSMLVCFFINILFIMSLYINIDGRGGGIAWSPHVHKREIRLWALPTKQKTKNKISRKLKVQFIFEFKTWKHVIIFYFYYKNVIDTQWNILNSSLRGIIVSFFNTDIRLPGQIFFLIKENLTIQESRI